MKLVLFTFIKILISYSISFSSEITFLERDKIKKKIEFENYKIKNESYDKDFYSFEVLINKKLVICNIHKFNKKIKPFCY